MPNISPQIFKEYDIRGIYPSQINEEVAYKLGRAFVIFQKAHQSASGGKKIVIGLDRRQSSPKIAAAFARGASDQGSKVFTLGICSTPELSFAVGTRGFDGGVMITASHNPSEYTGFKFVDRRGVSVGLKNGLRKIKLLADKASENKISSAKKSYPKINVYGDYYKKVASLLNKSKLKKSKLILDASGGAGDQLADYIFSRLPAKLIKLNFQSKSKKAPHGLNPLLATSQKAAGIEIRKNKGDMGLIWDGDGDRCIFLDEKGNFIYPYYINCLISRIILQKKKGIDIVVDARLPVGIGEVIKEAGGKQVISRSGTSNVIQLMQAKKLFFGCENSGHYFFNFSFFGGKNFAYAEAIIPALLILEYLADNKLKLSEAMAEFSKKYLISGEINLKVADFSKIKNKLKKAFRGYKFKELDGLSVFGSNWFFNIRPSNTEPLARLNIEAKNGKDLASIKRQILALIR